MLLKEKIESPEVLQDKIATIKEKIALIQKMEESNKMEQTPIIFSNFNMGTAIKDSRKSFEEISKTKPIGIYEAAGERVGRLVEAKNTAYGDSFHKCADFLKVLYPNGVNADQYTDMLCIIRIFDKLSRIATNKGAFQESPYQDIAGYAILGLVKDENIQPSIDIFMKQYMKDYNDQHGIVPVINLEGVPKERAPILRQGDAKSYMSE